MLRSIVLAIAVNVFIVSPVYALDIVDLPGADSSVPANAYMNYNYTDKALETALSEKEAVVTERLDRLHYRQQEKEKWIQYSTNTLRGIKGHSTVIRLHSGGDSMRLSMPFASQFGTYDTDKESQILVLDNDQASFSITEDDTRKLIRSIKDNTVENSESKRFSYQSLQNALWFKEIKRTETGKDIHTTGILITNPKNRAKAYRLTFTDDGSSKASIFTEHSVEYLLANYIVPSIQFLADEDVYSENKELNGFTYKAPKGIHQDISYDMNDEAIHVYTSDGYGQTVTVDEKSLADNSLTGQYTKMLEFMTEYSINLGIANPEYAVVWNDGVPSVLIDAYNPNGSSLLVIFTHDGKRMLMNWIAYDVTKIKFSHEEIRNMAEFVKVKNMDSYINTKWQPLSEEYMLI